MFELTGAVPIIPKFLWREQLLMLASPSVKRATALG
jgi:hypothetical protein